MSLKVCFGKKLKKIRETQNLTQQQLAELIDMQTHTIGQIETGRRAASFSTIEKLVSVLNIDYIDLFDFTEAKTKNRKSEVISDIIDDLDPKTFDCVVKCLEHIKGCIK